MATKASSLDKPKAKSGQDGQFKFTMPTKEQMEEQKAGGRGRIPGKVWYQGKCVNVVAEISKSSSNPMWTFEFVITKGPYAGRDFKMWVVLTDAAAWKVQETMEALGVDCAPDEEIVLNKKEVIGVGCGMYVIDDGGKDGDGEFSKLQKIRAHENGAGFRPGKLAADEEPEETDDDDEDEQPKKGKRAIEQDDDEDEDDQPAKKKSRRDEEEDEGEEEEERPAKRGKAPVSLGKKRK